MTLRNNIILNTDSYNLSHTPMYPTGGEYSSFYIESRGGEYDETVMFGLQAFIKEYLMTPITDADIDEAEQVATAHGEPFFRDNWQYILEKYNGYLPIRIDAVPEGLPVPNKNVLVQVINIDPETAWLNIEAALLRAIWYPTTVATRSREIKKIIRHYMEKTGGNMNEIDFKLHDFGARGVSSNESARLGGMAHLVNFKGTDTVEALRAARYYYDEPMAGFSIPAAQHSTITSWERENEALAYENIIDIYDKEGGAFAIVTDSYDHKNAINNIFGGTLKEKIQNLKGRLVLRPDSGDPVEVSTWTVQRLTEIFGYTLNSARYKLLPPYIRVIQGDGVNQKSIEAILAKLEAMQLSADNIFFGMGGDLLQKMNRDTLKFAMKQSAMKVNGVWRDVYKDPVTDSGKRSKKGVLALIQQNDDYLTIRQDQLDGQKNVLKSVFDTGRLLNETTLSDIRAKAVV